MTTCLRTVVTTTVGNSLGLPGRERVHIKSIFSTDPGGIGQNIPNSNYG